MAFPVVEGTPAETAVATASTTHNINLPASIAAGELLLIVTAKGTPATTTLFNALAGWTEVIDENVSLGMTIWARQADGAEGATVTMTSAAAVRSASIAYRISGAENPATQLPQLSTVATGSSTTPDATTCTPTGGAKDYLWISCFNRSGEEADDDTWVTAAPATPSAFGTLLQKACGTAGTNLAGMVATAQLNSNAASLDAGAFTCATGAWRAFTIAIHPTSIVAVPSGGATAGGATPSAQAISVAGGGQGAGTSPAPNASVVTGSSTGSGFNAAATATAIPIPGGGISGGQGASALVVVPPAGALTGGNAPIEDVGGGGTTETPAAGGATASGTTPLVLTVLTTQGAVALGLGADSFVLLGTGGAIAQGRAPSESFPGAVVFTRNFDAPRPEVVAFDVPEPIGQMD